MVIIVLSIEDNVKKEIIIKKSKFICHLYRIDDIDSAKKIIMETKKTYKDATHNCYAYICDTNKKMSDDGEPSKTAGMPILNVLESKNLNHILAIVTRYFGGIKLGANGLVRAYTDSVKEALLQAKIINLIEGIKITITFTYDQVKQIDYLLKDFQVINKNYHDNISYTIIVPKDFNINSIKDYLISYQEEETLLIPKNYS